MRALSPAFAEKLSEPATTLCWVWKVTRSDGAVFGFTDHDRDLTFNAVTFMANAALNAGAIQKALGLAADNAQAAGAFNASAITEADLDSGVWDGARVEAWRVDWTAPDNRAHMFAGEIGEVRRGVSGFEAELRGLQAKLGIARGRVFSKSCDADVGDARCGADLAAPAFQGAGLVVSVTDARTLVVSGIDAFADGWFSGGKLIWGPANAMEVAVHRASLGGAVLELFDAHNAAPSGAFTITAGCDKRFATCRAKFANALNFRGFPHMPGNYAMQAAPEQGAPLDGSSRFA